MSQFEKKPGNYAPMLDNTPAFSASDDALFGFGFLAILGSVVGLVGLLIWFLFF